MSISQFFRKTYNAESYNCGHFVCELWEHVTGQNIEHVAEAFRTKELSEYRPFHSLLSRLAEPSDPCLVVMRTQSIIPHVGVYIEGAVLHITEDGVRHESIDVLEQTCKLSYFK